MNFSAGHYLLADVPKWFKAAIQDESELEQIAIRASRNGESRESFLILACQYFYQRRNYWHDTAIAAATREGV